MVTAGAIILGSAILGAVGGSVGTTMALDGGSSTKTYAEESPKQTVIQNGYNNSYETGTGYPCFYYDQNGNVHYYYRKNGCY